MKFFLIVLLALLCSQCYVKPVDKYDISKVKDSKILLKYDYAYWKYLKEYEQHDLMMQMIKISDGALRFQIVYSDSDEVEMEGILEMVETMENIKKCIDDEGWNYHVSYKNDLQIGTVMLECMKQQNMFND
jgi:hypothetical protein